MAARNRLELAAVVGALVLLPAGIHATGWLDVLLRLFGDPQYLQATVEPYREFGLVILLGLQVLNNVFAPVPGQGIGVAYGLMYGVALGTLFGMLGTTIGTCIAVVVSKRYGRPLVVSVVGEKRFERYDDVVESTDVYPFVVLIVLPVIPDDAIAYLGGLTTISTRRLILWLSAARLPGMLALAWFGDGVASADYTLLVALTAVVAFVSLWVVWKREWILDTLSHEPGAVSD